MTKSSVTAPQFFALLYLSMLGSMFMYISSPKITIATAESLLRPLVFAVVSIIFAIPIYLLCAKGNLKENLQSEKKSKVYKGVALFYGVVYFALQLGVYAENALCRKAAASHSYACRCV